MHYNTPKPVRKEKGLEKRRKGTRAMRERSINGRIKERGEKEKSRREREKLYMYPIGMMTSSKGRVNETKQKRREEDLQAKN
jgi:hypothetical protein